MLKVAIDSGPLRSGDSVRGIGAHTRELISSLKVFESKDFQLDEFDHVPKDSKYNVIHLTSFNPYFISVPYAKPNAKVVLTIHDLIPLIYPKQYPGGLKGNMKLLINKYLIHKNVDAIITISETSKKDICRFLSVAPDKVHVVYLAPREIFKPIADRKLLDAVQKKYKLPKKFVLYVGDVNYNKNIGNLIRACKIADTPLVICGKQALDIEGGGIDLDTLKGPMDYIRFLFGKPHPELAHYESLVSDFKNKDVIRLGFVPDTDLVKIYNLASVYVQPSLYEGFGLPVLEALACKVPVVASKTQALVEIAEGAAFFVDAKNPEEIAKAIKNPLNSQKLPREYSWKKVAEETKQIYETI